MGFTITEAYDLSSLGITLEGLYVSLRGEINITKSPNPSEYVMASTIWISASQSSQQSLLQQRAVKMFQAVDYPSNPIVELYNQVKTLFEGYTLVDC